MWNSQTSLLKITGFLNKEKSTIKIINAVNLLKNFPHVHHKSSPFFIIRYHKQHVHVNVTKRVQLIIN